MMINSGMLVNQRKFEATNPVLVQNDGFTAAVETQCYDHTTGITWILRTSMDLDLDSFFEKVIHITPAGVRFERYLEMPMPVRIAFDSTINETLYILTNV